MSALHLCSLPMSHFLLRKLTIIVNVPENQFELYEGQARPDANSNCHTCSTNRLNITTARDIDLGRPEMVY